MNHEPLMLNLRTIVTIVSHNGYTIDTLLTIVIIECHGGQIHRKLLSFPRSGITGALADHHRYEDRRGTGRWPARRELVEKLMGARRPEMGSPS